MSSSRAELGRARYRSYTSPTRGALRLDHRPGHDRHGEGRQRKLTGNKEFLNMRSHAAIFNVPGLECQIIKEEWNIRISRRQIAKSSRAS